MLCSQLVSQYQDVQGGYRTSLDSSFCGDDLAVVYRKWLPDFLVFRNCHIDGVLGRTDLQLRAGISWIMK